MVGSPTDPGSRPREQHLVPQQRRHVRDPVEYLRVGLNSVTHDRWGLHFALRNALLRIENRVVLQLGVGAESGLVVFRVPSVASHVRREFIAVGFPNRGETVEPGVVDGGGPRRRIARPTWARRLATVGA